MGHTFQRIAIVNRGEAAMRFLHAAHEYNQEHHAGLTTIALFTEPDRHAMFVREADEAVCLGPANVRDANTGQAKSAYVDYPTLERALASARAEAVWAGWGFVAEHAAFADLCREMGIVFIGPDGEAMRRVGDKISSKLLAEQSGIQVVPWSGGAVESLGEAELHAERLGYPLLIKATAGGGGHGIRRVDSREELARAYESARSEAFKAFGDPTVFFEQIIHRARHVEVQVIGDHHGTTWAVGVRDCTVQRRHQKILEEAPCPVVTAEQDEQLRQAAIKLTRAAGYRNAGTVEFLYEPDSRRFLFMEMNTRLQVEHPVTECTTGLDLVKLQIEIARGGRLEGEPPRTLGHAIEVRLNAEDPENGFAPAPGTVERFRILAGPGVRVDTGVIEGDTIPAEYDSMIAKIIAHGRDREEALARLHRTLHDSVVLIRNGATNRSFLLELLERDEVRSADVNIGWMDCLSARGEHVSHRHAQAALVQAAIAAYDEQLAVEQAQFYGSAMRGRPQVRRGSGVQAELRCRGNRYSPKTYRLSPREYRVELDGVRIDAESEHIGPFESSLTLFGERHHVLCLAQGTSYRIEVDGAAHRIDRDDGGMVRAPMPAVVVSIAVQAGDTVAAGARLAVVEAMKMEMEITAPFAGTVRRVLTVPNVQVDTGVPLLQIDAAETAVTEATTPRVNFAPSRGTGSLPAPSACRQTLEELRRLMLGFDVDPKQSARLVNEWNQQCPIGDSDARRLEDEILNIFVDLCSLFQHEPEVEHGASAEQPSADVYLVSYLNALDARGEGLPEAFVGALRRVLSHYGVAGLERTPELEQALLWIYKSHQRVEQQVAPVLALLERRLGRVDDLTPAAEASLRALYDRIIAVANGSFPAIADLAREVRYRQFDQPLFEQARKHVYEQVEAHLDLLVAHPEAMERPDAIRVLVECPQPIVRLLTRRLAHAEMNLRRVMLKGLTWRYYRIRPLTDVQLIERDGHVFATAQYDYDGTRLHVFTVYADGGEFTAIARSLFPLLSAVPAGHEILIDFYVCHPGALADPEAKRAEFAAKLRDIGFPRAIHRIVVAVTGESYSQGVGGTQHFTFRWSGEQYEEDTIYRGIHPMMGKRLHLGRMRNFKTERLPSVEDVYLLHAVAKENPKDERLFACAEVRDVSAIRDAQGRILQLPQLERMLAEAMAGIRMFQSRRPPQQRLYWNRILLHVRPPLQIDRDELSDIIKRLLPAAAGLGLEQVVVRARIPNQETGELREMVVRISSPGGSGMHISFRPADRLDKLPPIKPLSEYDQKVVRMRQRGLIYPYEIVKMLTPDPQDTQADFPPGDFVEYDLDEADRLVPVERAYGKNSANIIVGVLRNFTERYPAGMTRVAIFGDPSHDLGAIAEPECRLILGALALAREKQVPLEWFALSAGAKISLESGVENMDWIGRVLRALVEFTQAGGEVNVIVNGINVGAQPYWNAEATMLMHTRGILVMTEKAAMVLTGKRALDYSGSVSAEDNQGIGGYDRIMGINGQAQYWAHDIEDACHILLRHYEHTYVAPGERFPRRANTSDPIERDVRAYPHAAPGEGFTRVGEILSSETNPGRKKPFDIRKVMMAAIDQDHAPLERWAGMRAAETAVVWDAHLGGYPVCLIGIESRPLPRRGFVPADGPDQWCAGTLFPMSSKKVARAINAASNNRPVVMLANLSGFDGSPESMRRLQLEYGAEIGRAVVNFKGPIVFCVISRYHGGAYVVFSRTLNEGLEIAALEGTYASVIGGAPAAAVVFAGEVDARARKDPRLQPLSDALAKADAREKSRLRAQWDELFKIVHSEKLGEMAAEFDRIHSVQRAQQAGALHCIIPPQELRPYLVAAVERGIANTLRANGRVSEAEPAVAAYEGEV